MPDRDLSLLIDAARAASEIALRHFGRNPDAWDKPGGAGPVTQADLEIDTALNAMLRSARPEYGWLSEETEDDTARLEHEHVFIVDPIDGTRAFMEGSLDWGHSLAVARAGKITAAVVAMPRHEVIFTATAGGGAFCNGARLNMPRASKNLCDATILTAKPTLTHPAWQEGCAPEFQRAYRSSLAYRLCLVANGRFDGMVTLRPTWEWDVAAGDLIAREAGAETCDLSRKPLRFNQDTPQFSGIFAAPTDLTTALHAHLAD